MHDVTYRSVGFSEIDIIRPLWEELNRHHAGRSEYFRSWYERMNFGDRKAYFRNLHESGQLRLDLASDRSTGAYIGYCISSLSREKAGEIESLWVDPGYRSAGIGTALVTRAFGWMDSNGAVRKRVSVSAGNQDAWAFYRKFGFVPRLTVLEQKNPGN